MLASLVLDAKTNHTPSSASFILLQHSVIILRNVTTFFNQSHVLCGCNVLFVEVPLCVLCPKIYTEIFGAGAS